MKMPRTSTRLRAVSMASLWGPFFTGWFLSLMATIQRGFRIDLSLATNVGSSLNTPATSRSISPPVTGSMSKLAFFASAKKSGSFNRRSEGAGAKSRPAPSACPVAKRRGDNIRQDPGSRLQAIGALRRSWPSWWQAGLGQVGMRSGQSLKHDDRLAGWIALIQVERIESQVQQPPANSPLSAASESPRCPYSRRRVGSAAPW